MQKLLLAIVSAEAVDPLTHSLVDNGFYVTQISSMGGFLRRGSATLVIGVDEAQVDDALALFRQVCEPLSHTDSHPATVFVLKASQFLQI
jgi:uncharacterized protein YaaQ